MLPRGTAVLLLTATLFAAEPVSIERRFAELKKNPPGLYAFLYKMPKGADLHSHLSGAVYAENFLETAADRHLCVDRAALALLETSTCKPGQPDAAAIRSDNDLRNALIDSFSMRNFVPGRESGHDHFFATFNKFGAVGSSEYVAEIARRAADQNESYVELMALSGGSVNSIGESVGFNGDFEATRQKLEAAGLAKRVAALKDSLDRTEQTRITKLGCRDHADSAACRVQIGYVYQVLREFPEGADLRSGPCRLRPGRLRPARRGRQLCAGRRRIPLHDRLPPPHADGRLRQETLSLGSHHASRR